VQKALARGSYFRRYNSVVYSAAGVYESYLFLVTPAFLTGDRWTPPSDPFGINNVIEMAILIHRLKTNKTDLPGRNLTAVACVGEYKGGYNWKWRNGIIVLEYPYDTNNSVLDSSQGYDIYTELITHWAGFRLLTTLTKYSTAWPSKPLESLLSRCAGFSWP
jgi:hypothetical protein